MLERLLILSCLFTFRRKYVWVRLLSLCDYVLLCSFCLQLHKRRTEMLLEDYWWISWFRTLEAEYEKKRGIT